MAPRSILPSIYATSEQLGRHADGLSLAPPIAARVAQGVEQLAFELQALTAALHGARGLNTIPLAR
jgi:FMN reductase